MRGERGLRSKILMVAALFMAAVFMLELPVSAAGETSCYTLYAEAKKKCADGAKKVSSKSVCSLVTFKLRKNVEDFYYATDSKQIYCVCIVRASSKANAKSISSHFKSVYRDKKNDRYLTKDERKIVKNAQYGYSGKYAWYVCLGTSSQNKSAVRAMKKKI